MIPYDDTPDTNTRLTVRELPAQEVRKEAAAIIDRILVENGGQPFGDLPKACAPHAGGCTIQVAVTAIRKVMPDLVTKHGIYGPIGDLEKREALTWREVCVLEEAARRFDCHDYPDLEYRR